MKLTRKTVQWLIGISSITVLVVALIFVFRPQAVIERALRDLKTTEEASFKATLALENSDTTKQFLGEEGIVEVTLDGAFDREPDKRDAVSADVNITAKTDSVSVQIGGEMRFIGDTAYIFIEKSPAIFPALVQLKGQWFTLERGGIVEPAAADLSDLSLFQTVRRIGREKIEGVSVVKYEAVASGEAVVRMLDSIASVLGTQLTEDQINNIRTSASEAGRVPVEFWITPWQGQLQRLSTVLVIPGGNTVRFTLTLHDQGKKTVINIPDDAISLQAAIQQAIDKNDVPQP